MIKSDDKKYSTFYFNLKVETTINESGIDDVFESDVFVDHTISISKYNHLAGSIYIKFPKELNHTRKGLINIQNTNGNE